MRLGWGVSRNGISSGCQRDHNYLHLSVAVSGIAVAAAVIPLLPAGAETLFAERHDIGILLAGTCVRYSLML